MDYKERNQGTKTQRKHQKKKIIKKEEKKVKI